MRRVLGTREFTHSISAALLALVSILFIVFAANRHRQPQSFDRGLAALSETYLPVRSASPLEFPTLTDSKGKPFASVRLQGHWTLIFFGFTACPLVCPKTLSCLSAIARNPESGVLSGKTSLIFVSVDTEHDTPQRVDAYLRHFNNQIIGLTGSPEQIAQLSAAVGAGYQRAGNSLDHSTSLFVVDPEGKVAGVLLHPSQPLQIVAKVAKLQRSYSKGDLN